MTKIERITNVLKLANGLKLASVKVEQMRGIRVNFEDENGYFQILKANLDDADHYYLWGGMPYEELINELKKHTK